MRLLVIRHALLVLVAAVVGCASSGPGSSPARTDGAPERAASPKRVVAAIRGNPISLAQRRTQPITGSVPGLDAIEELMSAGLVHRNDQSVVLPMLAAETPSLDNGQWKVFPDGRMETTYHLRPAARWHDGAPITSDDLLFTVAVEQDKEIEMARNPTYDLISSITAPGPQTVVVTWNQPFIEADAMFTYEVAPPLPRHLLESAYTEDKATFFHRPYWNVEFVGAGPFKLKEWEQDSKVIVTANDQYVLGRPKIDEIEVRFIPDPNTLMANVLAGVEMTFGRGLSIDQAVQVTDQWHDGEFHTRPYGWVAISPQFVNPSPLIVTDVRFRRAMLMAIDRSQLLQSLMYGRGSIAHTFFGPDAPEFSAVQDNLVRYEFDQRRAAQMLEDLGYTRAADGYLYDAGQQKLTVTTYFTVQNDMHPKATATVADYWQQVGVATDQVPVPIQRANDREYRAQFPTFELNEISMDLSVRNVRRFHSESTPLPENRFTSTGNSSRYRSAELDSYINTYTTTIPRDARMAALGQMVHHMTDQLSVMGLLNTVRPTMVSKRVQNVTGLSSRATEVWNVETWDVTS